MTPRPPPPPRGRVFEIDVPVRSYELDSFGHVNHAVLLQYLEHARFEALTAGGFPYSAMKASGLGVYVVRLEVDYVAEALPGDTLRIRTWAELPKRSSVVLVQEAVRCREPATTVLRARVTSVWVGPNGRPIRVPDEVRTAFEIECGL